MESALRVLSGLYQVVSGARLAWDYKELLANAGAIALIVTFLCLNYSSPRAATQRAITLPYTFSAVKSVKPGEVTILEYTSPYPMERNATLVPMVLRTFRAPVSIKMETDAVEQLHEVLGPHISHTLIGSSNLDSYEIVQPPFQSRPVTSTNTYHRVRSVPPLYPLLPHESIESRGKSVPLNVDSSHSTPLALMQASNFAYPPRLFRAEDLFHRMASAGTITNESPHNTTDGDTQQSRVVSQGSCSPPASVPSLPCSPSSTPDPARSLKHVRIITPEPSITTTPSDTPSHNGGEGYYHWTSRDASWFQVSTKKALSSPPILSSAEPGDIFLNRLPNDSHRFWIWSAGEGNELVWKSVPLWYKREDGKYLSLSKSRRNPSWVGEVWGKRMMKREEKLR
ncbi:hypothetical protein NM688_g2987 [Phlebia brevispora]|uniref:Uncharacterized protein n=1 Tax=Phlebia brevispora TaxID=194682 RepID=A0ACC1T6X8_9APHY|nr:hypothetical protein NM688_g2987 [Phlebia brevispora]